jgi:hypothetical protein
MGEGICPGVTHRETEFAEVLPGMRVFGACGPNALASVASNALGVIKHTSDVYWLMNHAGLCDSEGVTTLVNLSIAAPRLGLHEIAYYHYRNSPWIGWQAAFNQYAGVAPFVAQVVNGRALVDAISGDGENANNLQSHFIAVLGRHPGGYSARANRNLPTGYWVADGDNYAGGNNRTTGFAAANVLQFYPDTVMTHADPRGALVIRGAQGATTMAWTRTASGASDDKGHVAGPGVANAIFAANMQGSDGLMGETYYDGNDSFTPLDNGVVFRYSKATNAVAQDGASVVVALWEALQSEKAKPAPEPPTPPAPTPPTLAITFDGQTINVSGDTATLTINAK